MEQYLLVGGYDCNAPGGGMDFGHLCNVRMSQIIAQKPKTDLKFIICKFKEGTIEKRELTFSNDKKTDSGLKTIPPNYDKITSKSYTNNYFNNGQRNTLSITHIYDIINQIGLNESGTLQEFSIFSHSWEEGPVLVNSFDDRSTKYTGPPNSPVPPSLVDIIDPNLRDPDDKDCRMKDFNSPTMDVNILKRAFSENGYSWIWGCMAVDEFRDLIHMIVKMPNFKGTKTKDTDKFTLYYKPILTKISMYLGQSTIPKSLTITFAELKTILVKALQNTYAFSLAKNSNKRVYAALIGTGADYEPGYNTGLMKISQARATVISFYKTYLKIKTDPENRNYGEYLPSLSYP